MSKSGRTFVSLKQKNNGIMSKNEKILSLRAALAQQITDRTHNEDAARQIAGTVSADFIELFDELDLVLA